MASSTRATASSAVSAVAERCPIFRPARAVCFSYKCKLTSGTASARSNCGSLRSPFQPKITQQVGDRRRPHNPHIAQRQIAHRAHRLLELAGNAAALAGVVAVVRARRQLIHVQPVPGVTNISTASKPSSFSWRAMVVAISCARFSSAAGMEDGSALQTRICCS